MAYWIFKCNAEYYRIKDRLADPEERITWRVTRYRDEIKPGDTAFIWLTGRNRGICAVMAIESMPRMMPEIPTEIFYNITFENTEEWRTEGRLIRRGPYISHKQLRQEPGLHELSMFHGNQRATNFHVTAAEGDILMRLISPDQS